MNSCTSRLVTLGLGFASLLPLQALAGPRLSTEVALELGADRVSSRGAGITDVSASMALSSQFRFNERMALSFGATAESVLDAEDDRTFGDIGVYVDTLNLELTFGAATVLIGKFAPAFGLAWDATPGMWGGDLAGDYELAEQLGLGISADLGQSALGQLNLTASLFTADTTTLSQSAFTDRGRLTKADGGLGNTGRLENIAVTLDGSDISGAPGLSWHLGLRVLKPSESEDETETGVVFGLTHETELSNGIELVSLGEVAHFDNAGGFAGSATYSTIGLGLTRGAWHAELSGSQRSQQSEITRLWGASAGYTFENGVDLSLGFGRQGGVESAEFTGLRLSHTVSF